MAAGAAWVLNLDADVELARFAEAGGARYQPTRAVREAMRPHAARLAASLLAKGDVVVDEDTEPGIARDRIGRAFCPTPRALALLRRAGAEPEPHPPAEVLRAVNSRAFAASLGQTLPGAVFARDLDEARAVLHRAADGGRGWRVKRAFGMAGRGQRIVNPGEPSAAEIAFLRAGFAEGGVQIEPNVTLAREYAMHGVIAPDGVARLGALVAQTCDARGAWITSERVEADDEHVGARLEAEVCAVAGALARAGYFGPFGVDAFRYLAPDGSARWQPRSEINARYSMGFATGMPPLHAR